MTKTSTSHGAEIARYLTTRGLLLSVHADGTTTARGINFRGAKPYRTIKAGVPLADWREKKMASIASLPEWQRNCRALPSMKDLEFWTYNGVAETVTGDSIEPDGTGCDGAPSWLLILGLI